MVGRSIVLVRENLKSLLRGKFSESFAWLEGIWKEPFAGAHGVPPALGRCKFPAGVRSSLELALAGRRVV